jgi:hypothetical protein
MKSIRFFHPGWWKFQKYVLLLSAVNLVSSLVKVYVYPVVELGLTFPRIADSESHRICDIAGYMYDAQGP